MLKMQLSGINDKKYLAIGNAKASSGSMSSHLKIEAFYNEVEFRNGYKTCQTHKKVRITDKKLEIVGGHSAEYDLEKDYFAIFKRSSFNIGENKRNLTKMEY